MRQAQTRFKGEVEVLGRLKGEFAMQERRNRFGRASVSIIRRAVVCGLREALWDWEGGEAAETPQNLAKPMRSLCEAHAKP